MAVVLNRKNLSAVVHLSTNATINVAGNSTTSDIAISNETVTGASITQVWAGCGNGAYWKVTRGSNTVLVLDSTGWYDFAGSGCAITLNEDDDIVVTLNGDGEGYIMLDLQKKLVDVVTEY